MKNNEISSEENEYVKIDFIYALKNLCRAESIILTNDKGERYKFDCIKELIGWAKPSDTKWFIQRGKKKNEVEFKKREEGDNEEVLYGDIYEVSKYNKKSKSYKKKKMVFLPNQEFILFNKLVSDQSVIEEEEEFDRTFLSIGEYYKYNKKLGYSEIKYHLTGKHEENDFCFKTYKPRIGKIKSIEVTKSAVPLINKHNEYIEEIRKILKQTFGKDCYPRKFTKDLK